MHYLLPIFLIVMFLFCVLWLPWAMVSDGRKVKRERPIFDALAKRVENSADLTKDQLVELNDELVIWYKRTYLWGHDVTRYIIYLRGRIGVPFAPTKRQDT